MLTTTESFKSLLGHDREVSSLSLKEFDPKGQYRDVLKAVEDAVGGGGSGKGVKVFRVEHGGTRAEFYVVGVDDEGEGRVVGLKALAVES